MMIARILLLLLVPGLAMATPPVQTLEVIFATEGQAFWGVDDHRDTVGTGDRIPARGIIETLDGRAVVRLPDGSEMRIDEQSRLRLDELRWQSEKRTLTGRMETLAGAVMFWIDHAADKINRLRVTVGRATAGVRGTSFLAELDAERNARLSTHSGKIGVGDRLVSAGRGLLADRDGRFTEVDLPAAPELRLQGRRVNLPFGVDWKPVPGITRYRVLIARDPRLDDVAFLGEVDDSTNVRFDLFAPGTYYVVVQSIDALGFSSIPPEQPAVIEVAP